MKLRILFLLIGLVLTIGCVGAETFTFDDNQIPDGWTAYGGTWVVNDGILSPTDATGHTILQTNIADGDKVITAKIRIVDNPNWDYTYGGIATKSNTLTDFLAMYIYRHDTDTGYDGIFVKKMETSAWSTVYDATSPDILADTWYILKIVKIGNEHKIYLDDVLIHTETNAMTDGYISLYSYLNGCEIDWVEITTPPTIVDLSITPTEYIHTNDDVSISYDATNSHDVSVSDGITTWTNTYNSGTNNIIFPTDFSGASMSKVGEYTINFIESETIVETQTFDVKEAPLVTFISASDMHYQSSDWYGVSSTNQINDFVNNVNGETWFSKPDAIFIVGDHLYNPADFTTYKALLDNLQVTYYPVTGNHDNGEESNPEAVGEKGKLYYEAFGEKYDYKITINNVDFICTGSDMDYSLLVGTHGKSLGNDNNLNWFNSVVNPDNTTIVFNHLSFNKQRDAGGLEYFWAGEWNNNVYSTGFHDMATAIPVQEAFEDNKVELSIGGHNHLNGKSEKNGVVYITDGCMQQSPYNFKYIEVYNDRIEVHTIFKSNDAYNHYIIEPHVDTLHSSSYEYFRGLESEQDFTISVNNNELTPTIPSSRSSGGSSYTPTTVVEEETIDNTLNINNNEIVDINNSTNNNVIYYIFIALIIILVVFYIRKNK